MYKLFGYGLKDIPYIKRLKNRVFYSIIITIISLNIFVNISLNLKSISEQTLYNSVIVADLQSNLTNEQKNNLEKEVYKIASVKAVRYMDKSESFKNLQNELNISIPESSNPLSDSLVIYVKNIENLNLIQDKLEEKEEIKEVYRDDSYLKLSEKQGLVFSMVKIGSGVIAFFIALITIILFNLGVGIEFLNSANTGFDYAKNIKKSKKRGLFLFSSATVMGTLIFFNLYIYFRKYISGIKFEHTLLSFKEIILWHLLVIFIVNAIVYLMPANVGRIEYEDEEEAEYDDEFDEDFDDEFDDDESGEKDERENKLFKIINFDDEN